MPAFEVLVNQAVQLDQGKCCDYLKGNRRLFTSYAIPALTTNKIMTYSNLLALGPCFASALPTTYLNTMSAADFLNYYTNVGKAFQPDSEETADIVTKLTTLSASQASKEEFFFTTLKDLAVFYPSFQTLNSVNYFIILSFLNSKQIFFH